MWSMQIELSQSLIFGITHEAHIYKQYVNVSIDSWTSLYSRDRDSKNRFNKFSYIKTTDNRKFEERFQKKAIS
jgi:hypothetical protein